MLLFHQVSGLIRLTVWEEKSFEEFQDVAILDIRWKDLAIMNLFDSAMPPIQFWLNLTCDMGGDVV